MGKPQLQGRLADAARLGDQNQHPEVKGAVIAGAGAAVLSVLAVAADVAAGRLIEIKVEGVDLDRKLVAVWPRGHKLSDSSSWLLDAAHWGGDAPRRTS